MERKLVTIRKISELQTIDGADLIELAIIDGWQCVVKRGEFSVGDFCVYHEIDSFCPIKPHYEFLRKNCYKNVNGLGEGFRIKSMKLRGVRSQGLALPLDVCNIYKESDSTFKITDDTGSTYYLSPDMDIKDYIGVIKYEPPVPASMVGKARGNFPSFIPKTDEERINNLTKYMEKEIHGREYELTLKLDGTSMTTFNFDGRFGVCSRNLELKLDGNDDNIYIKTANKCNLSERIPYGFAVQGEVYGKGIGGATLNHDNLDDVFYYVFNIFDIQKQKYLTPRERHTFFATYLAGNDFLRHVPVIKFMTIPNNFCVKDFIDMADAQPSINNSLCEGIVFKRCDGEFSFKSISPEFLIKFEK